jgi:flagellar biosynthesis protein FliQ
VTFSQALALGHDALLVAMIVAAPALLLGLITGLFISVMQAVTQIQEPTLAFIPKIMVVGVVMLLFGPFMLAVMVDFMRRIFAMLPTFVR